MIERHIYRVGGHLFEISMPPGLLSEKELENYAPFRTSTFCREELLFSVDVSEEPDYPEPIDTELVGFEDENGRMTMYSQYDGGIAVSLRAPSGVECCRVSMTGDYRRVSARVGGTAAERRCGFDTAMMLLYAFASSRCDTLLIHASAVEYDGRGYLFLGKSGTGKSTHSRLWTEYVAGAKLLNDDNPVVRVTDGRVCVYGTPWSGKTPCYRSRKVETGGIVRLHQSEQNRIRVLSGIKAYGALLPSCSSMRWNHDMAECIHRTICRIVGAVRVYDMDCRPDRDAAEMCRNAVVNHVSCQSVVR